MRGLADSTGWPAPAWLRAWAAEPIAVPAVPAGLAGADLLGRSHEALLDGALRRAAGAHYTPAPVAAGLVRFAGVARIARIAQVAVRAAPGRAGPRVLDPAVGGGAFLLAAARALTAAGVAPGRATGLLKGIDVDPVAAAAAEAALCFHAWCSGASDRSVRALGGAIVVGDGLDPTVTATLGRFDVVLGNPPFGGQLGRGTVRPPAAAARLRARFGAALGAYTDTAAVFLLAALDTVGDGGTVALIQPESLLASRDAAGVRAEVLSRGRLRGLWVAGRDRPFPAAVRVCAPVIDVGTRTSSSVDVGERVPHSRAPAVGPWRSRARTATVARAAGVDFSPLPPAPAPSGAPPHGEDDGGGWARLALAAHGTPEVRIDGGQDHPPPQPARRLADVACVVAGFREEYYGLVGAVREATDGERRGVGPGSHAAGAGAPAPLVTSGAIEPGGCTWGLRPVRFAGVSWSAPVVDPDRLAHGPARAAAWVAARHRPKVLVATQTRVVEAVVDERGAWVPSVPVVSVEPLATERDEAAAMAWRAAAALLAPPVSAWALQVAAGSALAADAIKLAARQVRRLPLPPDEEAWADGTALLRSAAPAARFGHVMCRAYGLDTGAAQEVLAWWLARLPSWCAAGPG